MVELLVVISIIGILATLVLANYNAARSRARDTQRKSDLKQYQTAIENYATNNNGLYFSYKSGEILSSVCGDLDITFCPEDPHFDIDTGEPTYKYITPDGGADGTPSATDYVIWADMESSDNYWVYCSSGGAGESSDPHSSGNCPALD